MDDRDVILIEKYIQECTVEPELGVTLADQFYFDLHSYSGWAVHEILQRVMCEAMKLPPHISGRESLTLTEIVETFIDEMDYYFHASKDKRAKEIFEIARDEAKCVLLYINASYERGN